MLFKARRGDQARPSSLLVQQIQDSDFTPTVDIILILSPQRQGRGPPKLTSSREKMSTTELVLTCLSEKVDHKRKSKTMAPKKKKAAGDKPSQPIPQRRRGRPVIKIRARKSLPTPLSSPPLPQPKTAALSSWIESHATLLPNPAADYVSTCYKL